jgi:MOSC domain-containing protein YiiM
MAGELKGIARRLELMGPMVELEETLVTCESGVACDPRGQPGPRQVSLLLERDWREVGFEMREQLPWTVRRANLLVAGIELPIYSYEPCWLRIGDELIIAINGEMTPCWRMESVQEGLSGALALDWRCGRICSVVQSGFIKMGDSVERLNQLAEAPRSGG